MSNALNIKITVDGILIHSCKGGKAHVAKLERQLMIGEGVQAGTHKEEGIGAFAVGLGLSDVQTISWTRNDGRRVVIEYGADVELPALGPLS